MTEWRQDGIILHTGDCLDVLAGMEAESVNCVVTSPPFWGLRKYDCEPSIWPGVMPGSDDCRHALQAEAMSDEGYAGRKRWQHDGVSRQETPAAWVKEEERQKDRQHLKELGERDGSHGGAKASSTSLTLGGTATCSLCGAWRGWLGLEPTVEMFIEHTLTWMRAVKRVLRNDGVLWVDIDDSRGGGGNVGRNDGDRHDVDGFRGSKAHYDAGRMSVIPRKVLRPKSLCLIPQRLAIAAQEDGWIVRSDIKITSWMPESAKDRPTDAYRTLLMLVKQGRYWSDFHAVRVNGASANDGRYKSGRHEQAEYGAGWQTDAKFFPEDGLRNLGNVWDLPPAAYPDAHFATFPIEEPLRCIKASCPPDGVVLDCFAGTGTTLIAARRLGRRAIGIDVSESYIKQAKKRLLVGDKGIRRMVEARRAGHEQEMFPDEVWT